MALALSAGRSFRRGCSAAVLADAAAQEAAAHPVWAGGRLSEMQSGVGAAS